MKYLLYSIFMMTTVNNINAQVRNVQWSVAAVLPPAAGQPVQPGVAGPVAGISNDIMIVAGGANFPAAMPWNGGIKNYKQDIYIFRQDGKGNVLPGVVSRQTLPQPLAYSANVSMPEGLIYAGGENDHGPTDKVTLLTCNTAGEITFTSLPSLPVALTNLSGACYQHTLYIAGGESVNGPSAKFFSLDVSTPGTAWQTLADIPVAVSHAVMAVQDGGVYLVGGRRKNSNGISDIFNTTYRYDLHTKAWTRKNPLPYPVSAGTGLAVGDHEILCFSGDKGAVFSKMEALNAAISAATDAIRKEALTNEKKALLNTHPGFTKEVLLYNTTTGQWKATNALTMEGPVTTTALLWNGVIMIPSGEIKAGVRTPVIISGKLFFN
ncbi:N-acetylneuraminate epimerase [Chitinophaga sp. W2I13]|uniref:kelch repeat-containing protein n=1 Tax=Chitinophaga sp. W2I13 TaxID=3373923 RepID=UPI003D219E9A